MTVRVQARPGLRTQGTPYLIMVLLPVRNGAPHLRAQLDSLAAQTRLPGQLILSDDRSRDDTLAIAADFARRAPFPVRILRGPGHGVVANVMSLLASAPAGPLALVDQDEIWLPCLLERGAAALAGLPMDQPAIALAPRVVTDRDLAPRQRTGPDGIAAPDDRAKPCHRRTLCQRSGLAPVQTGDQRDRPHPRGGRSGAAFGGKIGMCLTQSLKSRGMFILQS